MRVLLINPQFIQDYIHSARWDSISYSNTHWYPIFLGYCTSLLEKHNVECKLIDAEADNLNDKQVISIAKRFKPNFTLIYISERGLEANIELAKSIKISTKSKIIFAGPWCSLISKEKIEGNIVNFIIDGEFEFVTLDIVEGKQKKKGYIKAKRLASDKLNELGWVTKVYKKHLNINNYRVSSIRHPYVDIFTSRKCVTGDTKIILLDGSKIRVEDAFKNPPKFIKSLNLKENKIVDGKLEGIVEKGTEELIELTTENKQKLKVTPDHKVYTKRGWIEARDLKEDDEVITYDEG